MSQKPDTAYDARTPGTLLLAIRKDDARSVATADGNLTLLQVDDLGYLRVRLPSAAEAAAEGLGTSEVSVPALVQRLDNVASLLRRLVLAQELALKMPIPDPGS